MQQATTVNVIPPDKAKIKKIWVTAGILAAVTAVEYVFAFTMEAGFLRSSIFVGLTIVKAGYIVGEFMHLKHEVKGLFYSVLLPMIFIVWLIVALVNLEGAAVKDSRGTTDYTPAGTEQADPGH